MYDFPLHSQFADLLAEFAGDRTIDFLAETASKILHCCAGSIAEILSSITNQYNGNGLQQGAGLVITGMLEAELKNNPVLLWMNGDVNYARSASDDPFLV